MLKLSRSYSHLATTALVSGVLSFPFWLMSYAWIPFRMAGTDTEGVWQLIVVSELSAMVLGIVGITAGWIATRAAPAASRELIRARRGLRLGILGWIFIVTFNVIGLLWFS